jgi:hypothetical protein
MQYYVIRKGSEIKGITINSNDELESVQMLTFDADFIFSERRYLGTHTYYECEGVVHTFYDDFLNYNCLTVSVESVEIKTLNFETPELEQAMRSCSEYDRIAVINAMH